MIPYPEGKRGAFTREGLSLEVVNILVIEDNDQDFYCVQRLLDTVMPWACRIQRAKSVSDAEKIMDKATDNGIHVILLDLDLPDSLCPQDTYSCISHYHERCPIIVLTGENDYNLALNMLGSGAQDFLAKDLIILKPELFRRVIEFSIERHHSLRSDRDEIEKELEQKSNLLHLMTGAYSVSH
ncbi:MAG: response regulator [Alphaproteobacteria bacterium]|jgi:two-component system sensor histidine kinase UhpB|nr:response regulator [Alphaproteobacteria bacterium]MCB1551335.1 response regulator [Alphaproteobacteria bacterium]MCB9985120.1 response regulator [Micavibrio sp.]HPQ50071.1 response regulator [Alphaproteobacteria bacterium]HRK97501.1 response regulator [Alphaproteobacteria bacterium]